jgi:NAD-dependent deacetylase
MNVLLNREPNRSHLALAKLEKAGKLKAVVTQNIDDLHNKAGNSTVLELHGNYARFRCDSACDTPFTCDDFMKQMETAEIPRCTSCGGVIRPCTVLFDEWLDDKTFEKSIEAISQADLLIVIGTSLQVQPAAGLVRELPKTGKLVIITESDTPYDRLAHLRIKEKCGDVLAGLQI